MDLADLKKNWDEFGKQDPFWAILAEPTKKGNKWKPEDFFKSGQEEIDSVIKYIEPLNNAYSRKRALDFGCGVGRLTQALGQYFDECYGVDIAPSMIELAKKYNRHGDKCRYYLNDREDLGLFEDNFFDLIYSKIVLQHMKPEYSKNYIKEFLRVLAPGGVLVFQIPSEVAPVELLDTLEDSAYQAQIALQKASITAKVGTKLPVKVKVKNVSDVVWPSLVESNGKYIINLGNHWLDELGKLIVNDDAREPLPKNLKPLEEVDILLNVSVPLKPGHYILELDMVHEQVTWFRDKGSQTTKVPVKVEATGKFKALRRKLLNFYSQITNKALPNSSSELFAPSMEMYGVPKNVVLELIDSTGGKVLDVQPDFSTGQGWLSFLYCITKE